MPTTFIKIESEFILKNKEDNPKLPHDLFSSDFLWDKARSLKGTYSDSQLNRLKDSNTVLLDLYFDIEAGEGELEEILAQARKLKIQDFFSIAELIENSLLPVEVVSSKLEIEGVIR